MAERRKITLRLSPEAHDGLQRACLAAGVTMTALFEAVGLELDRNPASLGERGPDVLTAARQIDQERRNRR